MNIYTTDRIRNVVLLGHGGAGKTTLVEAAAHLTGITSRMGSVTDGNSISDFDKEEIKRSFSISASVVPIEWKKNKINFLDAPGYFDFVGQAYEAAGAADAGVIVLNAKSGLQVGAQKGWNLCEMMKLPRMFFLTAMDLEDVEFDGVISQLKSAFGNDRIVPLHLPVYEGGKLVGSVNVVDKSAVKWGDKGKAEKIAVPADLEDALEEQYEALTEAAAGTSEELMEKYFEEGELSPEDIAGALSGGVAEGDIVPVCIGASVALKGVDALLDDILTYFPDPSKRSRKGKDAKTEEAVEIACSDDGDKAVYVWKTMVDPFIGKYSLIKVCSGVISGDDTLYNAAKNADERLGKVYTLRGNKPEEVAELHAGDIGALAKLGDVSTGETLSTKTAPVIFEATAEPVPYTYKRYWTTKKGDEDKVSQSIARLAAEDPTIRTVIDSPNHQSLLYGMGEQHLDIIASKLKERYKVEIELGEPRVAFKETIRGNSDVEGKHKKQSGGHGQYGHVKMRFAPSGNQDEAYEFEQVVVGGTVPKNYFPAVEKGLNEAVQKGPLAAYPVVGVKATLYDGSYHPVDSSEQAFKMATHKAFKEGFMKASPILLEPIVTLKVIVPNEFTGDVMGDLNKRRGRVLGMEPDHKGNTIITAEVPQLELYGYGTQLRSMTGGSGDFSYDFARYEQTPQDIQEKQIQARADMLAEDSDE